MIASSSHSLTFFFQSVKMSYINSAFQNVFIRCHRVPKSISVMRNCWEFSLGSPGRQVVTRVCHDLRGVTHWPIGKISIIAIPLPSSLLAITWSWSRPLNKNGWFFSGWFPPIHLAIKTPRTWNARKISTQRINGITKFTTSQPGIFAGILRDTHWCVFFLQNPKRNMKTQKVYGISKEPWKHKSSHVFFSKKFHVKSKLGSFDSHPNLFGEVFQVANSFRKHFPELKDNSYQTNRVMEKYLTESIETALETLKGWNILTTNSGGIWTKKNSAPRFDNFHKGVSR